MGSKVKFTEDHKKEMESNYFEQGIHEVTIGEIKHDSTDDGREFLEITVLGENDQTDTTRIWFTTDKAINYSFNVLRGIFVHNTPEAKREAMRKKLDAVPDLDSLITAAQDYLTGKKAWFSIYQSTTRTYTNSEGETKFSYDKNVYGYKPNPPKQDKAEADAERAANVISGGGNEIQDNSNPDEVFNF